MKPTLAALLCLLALSPALRSEEIKIDWDKAKELHVRAQRGDTLTPDEQKYYEEAKKQFQSRADNMKNEGFDWERAKSIYQRVQAGDKVSEEDMKFLEEAKKRRGQGGGGRCLD